MNPGLFAPPYRVHWERFDENSTLGRKYNYRRLSRFHCAANARKRNGWRADGRSPRGFHSSRPRASRIGIDAAGSHVALSSLLAKRPRSLIISINFFPSTKSSYFATGDGGCLGNGVKNLFVVNWSRCFNEFRSM